MLELIPGLSVSPLAQALLDASHAVHWANPAWHALCQRQPAAGELWLDQVDEASLREELPHLADFMSGTTEAYSCASRLYVGQQKEGQQKEGQQKVGPQKVGPQNDAYAHRPTTGVVLQVRRLSPDVVLVAALPAANEASREVRPPPPSTDEAALAAVIGHDFRQHVRMVMAYASLIERQAGPDLTPQTRKHVQTIEHHAMRLQGLFVDLVRWLRLGHETRVRSPCRIAELWHAAQADQVALLSTRQTSITHEGNLPTLLGDPGLLVIAFIEVLRNAVLYHGEGIPRVHLSAIREDARWCLAITDQGQGMSAVECLRAPGLFQRFHSWEHIPGNGMGLAIVQRVITQHGGEVTFMSKPAINGCQVQMRLPA